MGHNELIIIIIITIIKAVISIAPYLTEKGEHTALYEINNCNVYNKTSTTVNSIVIIFSLSLSLCVTE